MAKSRRLKIALHTYMLAFTIMLPIFIIATEKNLINNAQVPITITLASTRNPMDIWNKVAPVRSNNHITLQPGDNRVDITFTPFLEFAISDKKSQKPIKGIMDDLRRLQDFQWLEFYIKGSELRYTTKPFLANQLPIINELLLKGGLPQRFAHIVAEYYGSRKPGSERATILKPVSAADGAGAGGH